MHELTIMPLPTYAYGILMTFAFLAGTGLFALNCRLRHEPMPDLVDLLLVMSISGVVGARLMYIALFPEQFHTMADYLALHEGGLVFYGGLLATLIALVSFARRKKLNLRVLLDFLAPSLALGHAIGRFGCLINECCYGSRTDLIHIYRISSDPLGCYRHPAQLYEAVFELLLAIVLSIFLHTRRGSNRANSGLIAGFYLIAYSFFRFLIEFIRGDERGGFFTPLHLSPSQLTAVVIMVCAAAWTFYCRKKSVGSGVKTNEQK